MSEEKKGGRRTWSAGVIAGVGAKGWNERSGSSDYKDQAVQECVCVFMSIWCVCVSVYVRVPVYVVIV